MCARVRSTADTSEQRYGIWAHAWGSDPAEGPVILQCAYDWAVDDSRSRPFIRLEFASPMIIDQLIGAELAYNAESETQPELAAALGVPDACCGPGESARPQ